MSDPTNDRARDAATLTLDDLSADERRLFGRFLSVLAARGESSPPVLRTRRLEVVDHRGRARVVVGKLAGDGAGVFGVGVYDARRSERAALASGESGPFLSFSLDGDEALVLGVDDPETSALLPGPYLQLLGIDGSVAVGWRVDEQTGTVSLEGGDAAVADSAAEEPTK